MGRINVLAWSVAVAIAAALLSCGVGASADNSVGTLEFGSEKYFVGGTIHYGGYSVSVPGDYRVLHVSAAGDRLLITACWATNTSSRFPEYRSELWMFDTHGPNGPLVFEDRQVLVTIDSYDGERKNLCYKTVNCLDATALFIDTYGGGRTLIFDASGNEVAVDWPTKKTGDRRTRIDTIRPLTWIWKSGDHRLACMVYAEGDTDPYMLLYSSNSGEIELGRLSEVLGVVGAEIFIPFSNDKW